jgi:hypothetical protein
LNKIILAGLLLPIILLSLIPGQIGVTYAFDIYPRLEVSSTSGDVQAGALSVIQIKIRNVGTFNATDVDLTLSSTVPGVAVSTFNHKVFTRIGSESYASYSPVIYVDQGVAPGAYTLALQFSYNSLGRILTNSVPVVVLVQPYQPILKISAAPDSAFVRQGIRNQVSLIVENTANFTVSGIRVALVSSASSASLAGDSVLKLSQLAKGAKGEVTAYLDLYEATPLGSLSLTGSLLYIDASGNTLRQSISIPLTVVAQPQFVKVTSSLKTLVAGRSNRFILSVENVGGVNLSRVNLTFSTLSLTATVSGETILNVGSLHVDEVKTVESAVDLVEGAPNGVLATSGTVYFNDESGREIRQVVSIPFDVVSYQPVILIRNLDSGKVYYPGDRVDVNLDLECVGASASNVRVQVSPDPKGLVSVLGSTTFAVESLGAGLKQRIVLSVEFNGLAAPGSLPITLNIKYNDAKGIAIVSSEVVTFTVEPIVEFGLLKDVVVSAEQGKVSTFDSDLVLKGTGRVDFAQVEVVSSGFFSGSVGSVEYIGAIDPDSPVPFTVKFKTDQGATLGDSTLRLRVSYTDYRNVVKEAFVDVPVRVITPVVVSQSQGDGGFWGWIKSIFGIK